MKRRNPPVIHPVVRTHPETGRKSLLVNQRIRRFLGMSDEESQSLLAMLNAHATSPEFVYRHRWSIGDVVMWDNRCSCHVALGDFDQTKPRVMYRCSLEGEVESGRVAKRYGGSNDRAIHAAGRRRRFLTAAAEAQRQQARQDMRIGRMEMLRSKLVRAARRQPRGACPACRRADAGLSRQVHPPRSWRSRRAARPT